MIAHNSNSGKKSLRVPKINYFADFGLTACIVKYGNLQNFANIRRLLYRDTTPEMNKYKHTVVKLGQTVYKYFELK
jgi:hypothetical protein